MENVFEQIPPSSKKYIDQLSMELLLNKTKYQKYLSKTDPQKHAEHQEYLDNCSKFRGPILEITSRLLDGDDYTYAQEVNDVFQEYSQILIRYLELKEKNEHLDKPFDEFSNEDEDMLILPSLNENMNNVDFVEEEEIEDIQDVEDSEENELSSSHNKVNLFFHVPSVNRRTKM
jgi:hypothetical protein